MRRPLRVDDLPRPPIRWRREPGLRTAEALVSVTDRWGRTSLERATLRAREVPEWPRDVRWACEAELEGDLHWELGALLRADDGPVRTAAEAEESLEEAARAGWEHVHGLGLCLR